MAGAATARASARVARRDHARLRDTAAGVDGPSSDSERDPNDPRQRAAAARAAVERLARTRPEASAKHALDAPLRPTARSLVLLALTLAALVPATELAIVFAVASAAVLALMVFRIATLVTPPGATAPAGRMRTDPPIYSILVPLHRESEVVADLADALAALNYPALWSKRT